MIYVPATCLKPGMILARSLPSNHSGAILLNIDEEFTQKIIDRIIALKISGVYIKDGLTDDIEFEPLITPEKREALVKNIKNQFLVFSKSSVITNKSVSEFSNMAGDVISSVMSSDEILYNMVNIKSYDNYTYSHSLMVSLFSVLIGYNMQMTDKELHEIAMCALMHDIGKIDIPVDIINKKGKLSEEEFAIVKHHPTLAAERLMSSPLVSMKIIRGIESHHERFDGSGYPYGTCGKDISLYGRILAVADVYDALTSKRSYRDPWNSAEALEYLISLSDIQFDTDVVNSFLSVVAAYPVGSIVKLSNSFIGIVVKNIPGAAMRPTVRIVEPLALRGTDIDLWNDNDYLNVTVTRTIHDASIYLRDMSKTFA